MIAPRAALAALVVLALSGPALADDDDAVVKMDPAVQKRVGVATAPLASARKGAALTGFARVLDPVPLATLDADLTAAEAAAAASAVEAARAQALFAADATLSAKAAEAARAQARSDAAHLKLLRLRLGLEWGPAFGRMGAAARTSLIEALAGGRAALLRIDLSDNAPAAIRAVDVELGPGAPVRAAVLGPARTGDPRLQTTGLIAVVRGAAAAQLGSGMTLPVRASAGAGTTGVILPRSALLRTGGETIVYVRKAADVFEARSARGGVSQGEGLFVASGFAPGEVVAVHGAQALYAAQHPPAAEE